MKSRVTYKSGMEFTGEIDGFSLVMDTKKELGGNDKGPMPKKLLLTALAGCTGMEVVSILRKMRVEPGEFVIDATSESAKEDPHVFTKLLLTYTFKGGTVTKEQAERAVSLSHTTYCSISVMLGKACEVGYTVKIV